MGGRLLRFVRVSLARINLELAELSTTEAGLGKHAPDSPLDEKDGTTLTNHAWGLDFFAADVAGEAGVDLGIFLSASQNNLVGIDDDDEVTRVDVRGENRLVLAAEEACCLNGDLAEDFALGVDHIPLALDFVWLGGKCLHVLCVRKNRLRKRLVREGVGKLGTDFRGVNREILRIFRGEVESVGKFRFPGANWEFCLIAGGNFGVERGAAVFRFWLGAFW